MLKPLVVSAAALLAAVSAHALERPNANWSCANPSFASGGKFVYCTFSSYTSGTTATQLGTINVDPGRQVSVVATGTSALANVVTPTITFYNGSVAVGSLSISNSTAVNAVTFAKPHFTSMVISTSNPALISATNALTIGVIENGAR